MAKVGGDPKFLVIGSGLAGLVFALKAAEHGQVFLVTKADSSDTNSSMAQGGVAAVLQEGDTFAKHVEDTLRAGAGLCRREVVEDIVRQGPERIADLERWGVRFDQTPDARHLDLTREGGHSERRVVHVADHTGEAIHSVLLARARQHAKIRILENTLAVDLVTSQQLWPNEPRPARCYGAYLMNRTTGIVHVELADLTVLATGGAGKVYLYTSNWSGATGDGVAMAFRAGARVANLEFMQFHPTCLYHPEARNFLISEALRGEGGELKDRRGQSFMRKYHPDGSLAPRDVVARAIDTEMKRTGDPCVFLDMTHLSAEFLEKRFPVIYKKCLDYGIDLNRQPIPVVPAAHYLCGGVLTDTYGRTDLPGLLAIGETACTGLHGANRLASNSLLECLVMGHEAASLAAQIHESELTKLPTPSWPGQDRPNADELIVISHMWDEVRRLMWNYVGIVRSNRRLARAAARLKTILEEVHAEYHDYRSHPDVIELRNLVWLAFLTVKCAQNRKESRGIHWSLDYPGLLPKAVDSILSPNDLS